MQLKENYMFNTLPKSLLLAQTVLYNILKALITLYAFFIQKKQKNSICISLFVVVKC